MSGCRSARATSRQRTREQRRRTSSSTIQGAAARLSPRGRDSHKLQAPVHFLGRKIGRKPVRVDGRRSRHQRQQNQGGAKRRAERHARCRGKRDTGRVFAETRRLTRPAVTKWSPRSRMPAGAPAGPTRGLADSQRGKNGEMIRRGSRLRVADDVARLDAIGERLRHKHVVEAHMRI